MRFLIVTHALFISYILQLLPGFSFPMTDHSFTAEQKQYPRVRAAFDQKEDQLKAECREAGLPYPPSEMFIRVFKEDRVLEVWFRPAASDTFNWFKSYAICTLSGTPGPKRQQGDLQIPEGFYHIAHFNPASRFHLSIKINYPNESDAILGNRERLGGDIFIHGSCVTIGCLPITDESIKELYVLAVMARDGGQKNIPVHIFPTRLDTQAWSRLRERFTHRPDLIAFWLNLRTGYAHFERTRTLPIINVDPRSGVYHFQ